MTRAGFTALDEELKQLKSVERPAVIRAIAARGFTVFMIEHDMKFVDQLTEHALEQYRPMLDEMGVMRSDELVGLRSKTDVLVAGIRVATQTPPMRSGKRVVFVSLDDGSGCSDSTFFDEAQKRCSHILFNTRLLLISGKTRRTGVRGVSIMAENAWDLKELWNQWVLNRGLLNSA